MQEHAVKLDLFCPPFFFRKIENKAAKLTGFVVVHCYVASSWLLAAAMQCHLLWVVMHSHVDALDWKD